MARGNCSVPLSDVQGAAEKGHLQGCLYKKLHHRLGASLADGVNVFEKAVLNMTIEGLDVLTNMAGHLFEKSNLMLERQERPL